MSRKSKTDNTLLRQPASVETPADVETPEVGESTPQAGNGSAEGAKDSSAPGRDIPAQGAAATRYRFTWIENGLATGHDVPAIAYDAVHRGCNVTDHKHGTPYVEQLVKQGVLPKDFVLSRQS